MYLRTSEFGQGDHDTMKICHNYPLIISRTLYISYLSNIETTLREGIPSPGFPMKVLFVGEIC